MPKIIENAEEKILIAATELFLKEGYANTNIRKIAKAAGVSSGTIYTYFNDKETLFINSSIRRIYGFLCLLEKELQNVSDYREQLRLYIEIFYMYWEKPVRKLHNEIRDTDFVNKLRSSDYDISATKIVELLENIIKKINPNTEIYDFERVNILVFEIIPSFINRKSENQMDDLGNIDFIYKIVIREILGV